MSTNLQVMESAVPDALSAAAIKAQVELIHEVMREAMIKDVHYGVIPGTTKPTLLKPGAQKLMLTFRFDPQFETTERFVGEHLFVKSKCTLYHITSGRRLGSGEAYCSTKESKYAYRQGQRLCPNCGKDAIIKGKDEYGGGWLCWIKKDGCGAKWKDGAKVIEDQKTERVANEDLPDLYNTIIKMANKRSLIDAVLNVTGASDVFSQDYGDDEKEQNDDLAPPPPLPKGAEMLAKREQKPAQEKVIDPAHDYSQDKDAAPMAEYLDQFALVETPGQWADVRNASLRHSWSPEDSRTLKDRADQALKRLKDGAKPKK